MIRTELGVSYRRAMLDAELRQLAAGLGGLVVDVGGKRTPRGRFRPPRERVRRWLILNLDPDAAPDVIAAAEALPLRDASVDHILCQEVIQYVDRYDCMLAEFRRVLVPRGQVILTCPWLHRLDHATDRQRFSGARLVELFERAGLEVERLSLQGRFFTTLAQMLRQGAAHVPWRPLRAFLAAPLVPLGATCRALDRTSAVARSAFLSSFTTGYLITARKRV